MNNLDKRARMVRNHAYVMMKLREEQRKVRRRSSLKINIYWSLVRTSLFSLSVPVVVQKKSPSSR